MTLAESIVAVGLTLAVVGTAWSLVTPVQRASFDQPAAADVEQRARVAVDTIARDLAAAGSGAFAAGVSRGLGVSIPAFLPRRLGSVGDASALARTDAITMLSVPRTRAQTLTTTVISAAALSLTTAALPNCGAAVLCGIAAGDDVLVSAPGGAGQFDVFRVTKVVGASATLRPHSAALAASYPAGSPVSVVTSKSYYLDPASRVLRVYDGDQSDQPVVDHISALTFRYFGRGSDGGLEEMPAASLADGPWLGVGASQFDADLLRVRSVRVEAEAESANERDRGRAPAMALGLLVTPRALGVGR